MTTLFGPVRVQVWNFGFCFIEDSIAVARNCCSRVFITVVSLYAVMDSLENRID